MKKARTAMALFLTAVLALTSTVWAAMPEPTYVDGKPYVPLRATAYAHGAEVQWNGSNRSVTVTDARGNTHTVFVVAEGGFIRNGRSWIPLEYALQIFAPPQGGFITGAIHRVEYAGNVAYLFGSLHAERAGWFPLANVVEDAMRRADVFAFEIDMLDADATQTAMFTYILLPDGMSVEDILTPDEYAAYIYAASTYGMGEEDVRYISPILPYLDISRSIEMPEDMVMGMEQSVDGYVLFSALQLGVPIIGLEPAAQQMQILYRPPMEVLAYVATLILPLPEMVEAVLAASAESITLDEMAFLYENNDFEALALAFAAAHPDDLDDPLLLYQREMLFNFRSTYYANEILRLMRETEAPTTFFITVGLTHIIRSWESNTLTDIVEQLALQGVHAVPLWE